MEFEFLKSLVIILGVSAVVVFLLGRLNVSSVVGFLIAGVILGVPHILHQVVSTRRVLQVSSLSP